MREGWQQSKPKLKACALPVRAERPRWCIVEMEDIPANAMKHRAGNTRESISLAGKDPELQRQEVADLLSFHVLIFRSESSLLLTVISVILRYGFLG